MTISSRKNTKQRRIDELLEKLTDSDPLVVTELSRLGRSTAEGIALVHELVQRQIRLVVLKQNLDVQPSQQDMSSKIIMTLFSLFAELEQDLMSQRTKEVLAVKTGQGVKLGKPKGTVQRSQFDPQREMIEERLRLGLSVRKIAKHLGYPSHVKKRRLHANRS